MRKRGLQRARFLVGWTLQCAGGVQTQRTVTKAKGRESLREYARFRSVKEWEEERERETIHC